MTGGAVICAAVIAFFPVSLVIATAISSLLIDRIIGRRPEMQITRLLFRLVFELHATPRWFDSVTGKAAICDYLEGAAEYLQVKLPSALSLADPFAKSSLQEKCNDSAAYLRKLQVQVVLADDSTLSDLQVIVARYIAIFIESKYGLLPTEASSGFRQTMMQKIIRILKTLLIAIIPIGCLVGIRYAGIKLSGPLNDWVIIVALLWAIVSFISLMDPAYKSRIEDMSNILSAFRRQDRG
jgi:hypothetical protein